MEAQFTTLGAIIGLVIAIVLIIRKVQPAYSLILGALIGGLIVIAAVTALCIFDAREERLHEPRASGQGE